MISIVDRLKSAHSGGGQGGRMKHTSHKLEGLGLAFFVSHLDRYAQVAMCWSGRGRSIGLELVSQRSSELEVGSITDAKSGCLTVQASDDPLYSIAGPGRERRRPTTQQSRNLHYDTTTATNSAKSRPFAHHVRNPELENDSAYPADVERCWWRPSREFPHPDKLA